MNKIWKWILVVSGVCVLLSIAWFVSLLSAFGFFDKAYSTNELKANFEEKKVEIY